MRHNRQHTKSRIHLPAFLLLSAFFWSTFSLMAFAATDDTQQPIHIEADQAELLEQQGIMTYTGHVLLKQGGIEVRADTVVVFTKDGELLRVTAEGQPVHYLQRSNQKPKQDVKGKSQRMEYTAKDKRVLLLGNAEFWQGGNHFSGHRIEYDPGAQRVIATANGKTPADTLNTKQQRVTVTLQPKSKPSTPSIQTDKPQP